MAAAKLETTSAPGIFRRHTGGCQRNGRCDCSYVIGGPCDPRMTRSTPRSSRLHGKQRFRVSARFSRLAAAIDAEEDGKQAHGNEVNGRRVSLGPPAVAKPVCPGRGGGSPPPLPRRLVA
jgi:hypothetical protein